MYGHIKLMTTKITRDGYVQWIPSGRAHAEQEQGGKKKLMAGCSDGSKEIMEF